MTDTSETSAVADEPDPAETPLNRHRPRWLVAVVAGGVVVVLVAAGLVGTRVLGWWGDDEPAASPQPSPSPTERMDPFAGTPAEDFADGADGIVLPEAEAIGEFTADEVAEALEQVRDALIAARLDSAVMVDHELDVFLELLARDQQRGVRAAIEASGYGTFPTLVPPSVASAPELPRVAGDITYELATAGARDNPIVQVVTRFAWVYPFGTDLVVVRDRLVWEVVLGRPWVESSHGLWLADGSSVAWGAECTAYPERLAPADAATADLTDGAIFDPEQPLDAAPGC